MSNIPKSKPQQKPDVTRELFNKYANQFGMDISKYSIYALAIRGYYEDTMGKPDKNDRGIYDDAIFIITPDGVDSWNANVDPSVYRKHIASLKAPQLVYFKKGIHGLSKAPKLRYEAFTQASEFIVMRDQENEERGYFGINLHRGGYNGTSSLGCQTIPPKFWNDFKNRVYELLTTYKQDKLPYIIIDNP